MNCMSDTITVRLRAEDRRVLEDEARERGQGVSTLVRDLAEAEVRRLRREAILAEGRRVVSYVERTASARGELRELGTPQTDDL